MDVKLAAARYSLGLFQGYELPVVANAIMTSGRYSRSILALAQHPDPFMENVAPLFEQALDELGVALPTQRAAVLTIARSICLELLEYDVDHYALVRKLIREAYINWDEDKDRSLDAFLYWEREYEHARGEERRRECIEAIVENARHFIRSSGDW